MSAPLSVAARGRGTLRARGQRLVAAGLVALPVLLLASGWLIWDNRRLVLTRTPVQVASVPAGEVLRIAHVSDLHAADHGRFQDELVRAIEVQDVDLVALSGDLIDRSTADLGPVLGLASRLEALAPTYFVLGNHEADSPLREELLEGLSAAGVLILRDEATSLEVRGRTLTLVGLDDPRVAAVDGAPATAPGTVLERLGLGAASTGEARGRAPGGPTVLLAHRPELLAQYAGHGVDVVLSGHAHGGQVRLPLIGPLFAPHQGPFPALTAGAHRQGGTTMVVSRGLGNGVAPVRVNNPRELVIVDLAQETAQG